MKPKNNIAEIAYLSAPIHVWWDITRKCNFNCRHCYSASGCNADTSVELSTAEACALVDQLHEMQVAYVYILGGEPFIREDIFVILDRFAKHQIPVMINTNGWFITEIVANKLSQTSVVHLRFSLDGSTAKLHDTFRSKPGSYDRVIQGIKLAKAAGIEKVTCSYMLRKETVDDIANVSALLSKIGADAIQISPISDTGRATNEFDQPELLDAEDVAQATKMIAAMQQQYGPAFDVYSVDGVYDRPFTKAVKQGLIKPDFTGCTAGRTCCAIDCEGNVIPCILWRNRTAGSLREQTFYEIWQGSPLFKELRQPRGLQYPACKDCEYESVCARECPISNSQKEYSEEQRKQQIAKHCGKKKNAIKHCCI